MTLHQVKSEVGVRELHDHLSRYVKEVAAGREILVTSRGQAVIRLVPAQQSDPLAELRNRGLVHEPTQEWRPKRRGRPRPTRSVADLVSDQRR
jgi:prevent-host-death family protein